MSSTLYSGTPGEQGNGYRLWMMQVSMHSRQHEIEDARLGISMATAGSMWLLPQLARMPGFG